MNVVVVGGTGLIGREVVRLLAARPGVRTAALVRKKTGLQATEHVFPFADPAVYARIGTSEIPCDVLLCCIGSTMRAAGSKAAFRAVEHDIPVALVARAVALSPRPVFGFVSSAGAGRPVGLPVAAE